jgi:uncharacterized caspase-like protein
MRFHRHLALFAGLLVFFWSVQAWAEKRVALVIGNAAYVHASVLTNPVNDAQDISAVLRRLGFQVIEGKDLNKSAMTRQIRRFSGAIADADVALFFYSGHGLQVNGINYIAPIDAKLASEADLDFDMVPLSLVLRQMGRMERTNLVFLDACRNNPMLKDLARSMGVTRGANLTRGLARVSAGVGTMIAYATSPDQVAYDGTGRNSPFTTAVLKHIETPGQDRQYDDFGAQGRLQIVQGQTIAMGSFFTHRPFFLQARAGGFDTTRAEPTPAGGIGIAFAGKLGGEAGLSGHQGAWHLRCL